MAPSYQAVRVAGVSIACGSFADFIALLTKPVNCGATVHFANAKTIVDSQEQVEYRALLNDALLVLPDGLPVAWSVSRAVKVKQLRICGPDIFGELLRNESLRHFLIAPREAVLAAIKSQRHVNIVGYVVPNHVDVGKFPISDFVERIKASGATHVWVGIGSPKQDFLAHELAKEVNALVLGVGAAMEFFCGLQQRAPLTLRRLGLEWLHRLCSDPRRLWRRYLLGNIRCLWILWRARREIGANLP